MKIVEEETNLEDLIIFGEEKQIPITIEFPQEDKKIKARARIKPLTLTELDGVRLSQDNMVESQVQVLEKNLLKTNGDNFTKKEIMALPIGVINKIVEKIMEVSGVDYDADKLRDF